MSLNNFTHYHLGNDNKNLSEILKILGYKDSNSFIKDVIPSNILEKDIDATNDPSNLSCSEVDALKEIESYANENKVFLNFIGYGYYGSHMPKVVQRAILENPGWYTAYTPYQAEISQGRLEMLMYFQQMVIDLTGLPVANASLLDEATAAAEAMILAKKVNKNTKSNSFIVSTTTYQQTKDVLKTRASALGIEIVEHDFTKGTSTTEAFGTLIGYPASDGAILANIENLITDLHKNNSLVILTSDLLALTKIKSPATIGADITIGNTQRFGVGLGYGGPHAAFIAIKDDYKRSLPGRIIGASVDTRGNMALRMALQTREQHIRRDKATSNICTAQALLAILSVAYAMYHGRDGLLEIANKVNQLTANFAKALAKAGFKLVTDKFFCTLEFQTKDANSVLAKLAKINVNLRLVDDETLGISFDETHTLDDANKVLSCLGIEPLANLENLDSLGNHKREDNFLTHPGFRRRSETELMRYFKRLENRDISLTKSMMPLGSCTMKLNSAASMFPVTNPKFANIHPLAPNYQTAGYQKIIKDLEDFLAFITGFEVTSLQPNAGSQGEFAGLLTIKKYHESRGDKERNICLIPISAHGTNPASAAMANMNIVVVKCQNDGNVDLIDLKEKAEQHNANLAAFMITYPSTHGVFEEDIAKMCDIIHANGGMVYMDGANLNAQIGLTLPKNFGADICHFNLHKTFAIPHGGGGPGIGPISCVKELAKFLPSHFSLKTKKSDYYAVSAAAFGSAGILPISWLYLKMLGLDGLKQATTQAIINANYLAKRLSEYYPILFKGAKGFVAHECIVDIRDIKAKSGVSEEDIAKRLIDFGFHAPTISFPVAGTLMIEPTESESKQEMDKFLNAMIAIKLEIDKIIAKEITLEDSAIRNAPHTLADLVDEKWERVYSKKDAVGGELTDHYLPPVNRIDNVHGERHLICSCPDISEYL